MPSRRSITRPLIFGHIFFIFSVIGIENSKIAGILCTHIVRRREVEEERRGLAAIFISSECVDIKNVAMVWHLMKMRFH